MAAGGKKQAQSSAKRAPRVVIAGCGFGGLAVASGLRRLLKGSVEIIAIDKTDRFDYHATLPELVSGKIKDTDITIPYAPLFSKQGIRFIQGKILSIDHRKKLVLLEKSKPVKFDYLVLSVGSETEFYGVPGAEKYAYEFKSDVDALAIRTHVETMFESCPLPSKDNGQTRIVVVGGGLTGVELVADLKDLLDRVCERCSIPPGHREIVLVSRSFHLNPGFTEEVGIFTEKYLKGMGIRLELGNPAVRVDKETVTLKNSKRYAAKTIVWCAGIRPAKLAEQFGGRNYDDRCGLVTNKHLQWIADRSIFVVGDCGYCSTYEVQPILTALRAIEQSDYVVHNLGCEIRGNIEHKIPYSPRRFPAMVSLGHGMGLISFNGVWAAGRHIAWLKKLSHHMHLLRFRNNWSFLEYFDEMLISFLELLHFAKVRKK